MNARSCSGNFPLVSGEFELASNIILLLQTKQLIPDTHICFLKIEANSNNSNALYFSYFEQSLFLISNPLFTLLKVIESLKFDYSNVLAIEIDLFFLKLYSSLLILTQIMAVVKRRRNNSEKGLCVGI